MATFVQQLGGGNVFLDGGYVQGGYFLTGENTGYNKLMGAMDYNVKPHSEFFGIGRKKADLRLGCLGSWPRRWSWLDLSSTQGPGGQLRARPDRLSRLLFPRRMINPGVLNEPTIAAELVVEPVHARAVQLHPLDGADATTAAFTPPTSIALRFQTEF